MQISSRSGLLSILSEGFCGQPVMMCLGEVCVGCARLLTRTMGSWDLLELINCGQFQALLHEPIILVSKRVQLTQALLMLSKLGGVSSW